MGGHAIMDEVKQKGGIVRRGSGKRREKKSSLCASIRDFTC